MNAGAGIAPPEAWARVLSSLYAGADRLSRFHVNTRILNLPLPEMAAFLPADGEMLEIGCGHGVVANYLALASPARRVTGIDISATKIDTARATVGVRKNIAFFVARFVDLPARSYDALILSDVLYLMDEEEQRKTLELCRMQLRRNGICLVKEVDFSSRWTLLQAHIHERIMKDILHLTKGSTHLTFHDMEEWDTLLTKAGLSYEVKSIPATRPPLTKPSWIFICQR